MRKLYQNLRIEGEEFNVQNTNRENSKFWNEGKFDNFIKPHLPTDCTDMTFVEMGANCGIFLKMAKDMGFRNVIGIEKDKTPVAEGKRYRDLLGYDYKLLQRQLGGQFGDKGTFDINELPVADYTVMSTFHYYIDINSWIKYLDQLRSKTRYVVIVSRHVIKRHWRAYSDLKEVRKYFKDWEEVSYIAPISKEGDPNPRDLWSICFKSPVNLSRLPVEDVVTTGSREMYLAVQDLANEVGDNDEIDPLSTEYSKQWHKRKKGRWKQGSIDKFVTDKTSLLIDVKRNGLKEPLLVHDNLRLCDGGHRLSILKKLGYKNIIVRKI